MWIFSFWYSRKPIILLFAGVIFMNAGMTHAQISISGCYLSGALLQQNSLAGCGNAPNYCNLASVFVPAFSSSACGISTLSGSSTCTLNTVMLLPAGCTATIQAQYMKRNSWGAPVNPSGTGCSNCGMDGTPDALKILSAGGTIISQGSTLIVNTGTCAAYPALGTYTSSGAIISPGCNNADATVEMIVTGGTFSVGGVSNRSDELITYTINMSGTCGAGCDQALPVRSYLDAIISEDKVEVHSTIYPDNNFKRCIVQKSPNALKWEDLAEIYSSGRLYDVYSYTTLDPSPYRGLNYYRLILENKTGEQDLSELVSVMYREKALYSWYQSENELVLFFSGKENYSFALTDLTGRVVYEALTDGENIRHVSKAQISRGIYFLSVNGERNAEGKLIVY